MEQIRFEDALEVKYDISCNDFKVPALTIEPLAENAVRHGVRENDYGRGCVTISAREFPDRYEVSVADNGPGFDPDNIPVSSSEEEKPYTAANTIVSNEVERNSQRQHAAGRNHIGIKNVRERIRKMCGGELLIESSPGHGTTARIIIPKEGVV